MTADGLSKNRKFIWGWSKIKRHNATMDYNLDKNSRRPFQARLTSKGLILQ